MAQAAHTMRARGERARPRLQLAPPPRVRRGATARGRRLGAAESARWAKGFRTYLVVVAVVGIVACGRVALTTRAAEATLSSSAIVEDIKTERLEGDKLQVSKSSLATPSRIRDIAGESMEMVEPGRVEYLDVPNEASGASAETASSADGLKRLVAAAMDLAAGEAQVLLVGDVGLASSR